MSTFIDFPGDRVDAEPGEAPRGPLATTPPTLLALGAAGVVTLLVSVAAALGAPALAPVRVGFVVFGWGAIGILLCYTFLPGFDWPWRLQARAGRRGERVVALTIDDGPHPATTDGLLAALDRAGVKATFFLRGDAVEQWPELARRIVDAGHEIGNHTQRHRLLVFRSARQVADEIARCQRAVERLVRAADPTRRVSLFRPPHGFKPLGLHRALRRHGLRLVTWQGSIRDTDAPGVDTIVRRAAALAAPGRILLLHDNPTCERQTADALPRIVEHYRARGFTFVTL